MRAKVMDKSQKMDKVSRCLIGCIKTHSSFIIGSLLEYSIDWLSELPNDCENLKSKNAIKSNLLGNCNHNLSKIREKLFSLPFTRRLIQFLRRLCVNLCETCLTPFAKSVPANALRSKFIKAKLKCPKLLSKPHIIIWWKYVMISLRELLHCSRATSNTILNTAVLDTIWGSTR